MNDVIEFSGPSRDVVPTAAALERALAAFPRILEQAVAMLPAQLVYERNKAEWLRDLVRKAKLGMHAQNACAEARFRFERRIGEFLIENLGHGRPAKNVEADDNYLRLDDVGISRDMSRRCQRIARIPPVRFERFFAQAQQFGWEITNLTFFLRTESEQVNEIIRQRQEVAERSIDKQRRMRPMSLDRNRKPTTRIIHGDCLDVMTGIADQSIDLIITDLPYGATKCSWDIPIDLSTMWVQYQRIIKTYHAICLTATQPFASHLVVSAPHGWFKLDLVWVKTQGTDFIQANNRPLRIHETILVFSEGKIVPASRSSRRMPYYRDGPTTTDGCPKSVVEFARDPQPRVHPTQKPVGLMRWLIEMFTLPGETVLDSCMGSGTTGVAALESGRSFVGIDEGSTRSREANSACGTVRDVVEAGLNEAALAGMAYGS